MVGAKETLSIRRSHLLLYLLSKIGIIDHDRLVKLVFILSNKLKEVALTADIPFKYNFRCEGTILFSTDLDEDLARLTRMGFVEARVKILDKVFNIRVHEYKLTKYGEEVARRTGEELGQSRKTIDELIKEYRRKSEGKLDEEIASMLREGP